MMNKLLTSLFLSSVITLGGCGLTKENYYVKHVEFPQDATLEQKSIWQQGWLYPQQAAWQQMGDCFPAFRYQHIHRTRMGRWSGRPCYL